MLKKTQRATTKEMNEVFLRGKYIASPDLNLKYIIKKNTEKKQTKIAFSVPKNAVKNNVERNLLRRRGYKAIKNHIQSIPNGFFGVFIYGKNSISRFGMKNKDGAVSQNLLENTIKSLINRT